MTTTTPYKLLTSDDNEDELEAHELAVYCTERHVIHVFGQGLSNCMIAHRINRIIQRGTR